MADPSERSHQLGDLQHAIMRVLWDRGEATVSEVHQALQGDRQRALTTIATMLTKLEKKGVVDHRSEGRQYVYRPTVSEEDVTRTMVSDLVEKLFEGDATALVGHLLEERDIEASELDKLQQLVRDRRRAADDAADRKRQ